MKRLFVIIALLLLLILIVVVVMKMLTATVSPQSIAVSQVDVSDHLVTLKGNIIASAVGYRGYKAEYHDGKLFIKIKGSVLPIGKLSGRIDISIENQFGKIDEVYLQGNSSSNDELIWPQK